MMWTQLIGKIAYSLLVLSALSGCVSYSSLLNYHTIPDLADEGHDITNYDPLHVQANDILYIEVASEEMESARLFNKSSSTTAGGGVSTQSILLSGYLVAEEGTIDFPLLGKIMLAGLPLDAAREVLVEKLRVYFVKDPVVTIRLLNFNVNVNGEVSSPGSISVATERITAIEAITQAGDFTPYSRRDSILVIREFDGQRKFGYLDFNSSDVMKSPYFYLQQNDVIYVQPEKRKLGTVRDKEARYLPWISAATGFIAFVISVISLSK